MWSISGVANPKRKKSNFFCVVMLRTNLTTLGIKRMNLKKKKNVFVFPDSLLPSRNWHNFVN